MAEPKALSFPPEVFEKLEPELYLQRHLAAGLRPGNREIDQFNAPSVQTNTVSNRSAVGSSVFQAGGTTVVCAITIGVTETESAAGIYPHVEVVRGGASRRAPPSEEEMILSQRLFELLATEPVQAKTRHLFTIPDVDDHWLIFQASIQVLSRSGPVLDAVWNALVAAIRSIDMPRLVYSPDTQLVSFYDEDDDSNVNDSGDEMAVDLPIDHKTLSVQSSTYGLVELRKDIGQAVDSDGAESHGTVLLAGIEGDTEEACTPSMINIVRNTDGTLAGVTISVCESTASGGNSGINLTKQHIQAALDGAAKYAKLTSSTASNGAN